MPRLRVTRKALIIGFLFIVAALAFLYFVLPQIAGLDETWHRIEQGDPWWLALALAFTVLSFAGYVVLFEYVYVAAGSRIDLRTAYQITMASLAATRVFAAALSFGGNENVVEGGGLRVVGNVFLGSSACKSGATYAYNVHGDGSTCGRATRSRWPASRPRGCSPRAARAASP